MAFASGKHLGIIREASGKHLAGKHLGGIWASGRWEASGKHLGGIREASGKPLGDLWGASGHLRSWEHLGSIWEASLGIWDLGSIWEASETHLGSISEASTLGFPPWSERCLLETPGAKIQADHPCMFLPVCFLLVMCWSILGNCIDNNNGNVT